MILNCGKDQTLELRITNYQSGKPKYAHPCGDWLMVKLRMEAGIDSWTTEQPAMMTSEVKSLAHWLEKIPRQKPPFKKTINFMLPGISFEALQKKKKVKEQDNSTGKKEPVFEQRVFRMVLSGKCKPAEVKNMHEYYIKCIMTDEDFMQAAKDLLKQLEKFPIQTPENFYERPVKIKYMEREKLNH